MIDRQTARVRRWSFVLGSSIVAMAAASATPASAQCSPDPTVADNITDCTGMDSDGLRVTTDGSTVQVAPSASVSGTSSAAITVDIAAIPDTYSARTATITVGGSVDGGTQSGISVLSGSVAANNYDFYGTQVDVTVEAGASITGAIGISAGPSATNNYAPALVSITNAGAISGTSGVALRATNPARGAFDVIENQQGGTIGAIVGTIGTLNNAGVIDGGALSAIDQTTTYNNLAYPNGWINSGTIRSTSTASTIANLSTPFNPLTNSGTIANAGTGAAIQSERGLDVVNLAGGTISTAGSTAISAGWLTLTNSGTIIGDIVTQPPYGYFSYSVIDSTQGTIAGNVSLGSGNDLVYGRYDGTENLVTGITGTLDAGLGINSLVLKTDADLTISTAIALPAGFQRLQLATTAGTTLTLAEGFVAPGMIVTDESSIVVNEAAITTLGQAFTTGDASNLTNTGSINATGAASYSAVGTGFNSLLTNSGTITSGGDGVIAHGDVVNSGTILAVGTAVYMSGETLTNSGTIRSTSGVGVVLSGNTYYTATNSGTIEGATYGAVIGYVLNNSGTISTSATGTAVGLGNYGVLNNLAGGVIDGGAWAITGKDSYGSTSTYNARVFNAGTINGDVTFVSPRDSSYYSNNNIYVALTGGVLNGNLTLGMGDTLVTDLVNTGQGQFAGINGTVTTTGGLLRYRVSGEASTAIGAVGPFATTGYELVDGAKLTLTADVPQTLPLILAGTGTVDLTADIQTTNQTALRVVWAARPDSSTIINPDALTIVNHGTISGTINDYWGGGFGVVSLTTQDTLQNEGTINAAFTATNGGTSYNAAVTYGSTLVNNGRITLDGSYGAYNVDIVVNTGTIEQTGPGASYGIYNAHSVTNSGTIRTADSAISGGYGTRVINSGTIASTAGTAISSVGQVTNLAGGTISGGGGMAISMSGGSVANAGSIIGDVDLGYWGGFGYGSAYYANGGTLTGNLTLGSGDDLFLQSGPEAGVSGTIDAGLGRDTYGIALSNSGSVTIGAAPGIGFEDAMIAAVGADTVATVTGLDAAFTDLHAAGDGTVVNAMDLSGALIMGSDAYTGQAYILGQTLGTLINDGSVAGGVSGSVDRLVNTGTIGSTELADAPIMVWNWGDIAFENSGTVIASQTEGAFSSLVGYAIDVANSGTIAGGFQAYAVDSEEGTPGTITVTNSGTISDEGAGAALQMLGMAFEGSAPATLALTNSGTISANGEEAVAVGLGLAVPGYNPTPAPPLGTVTATIVNAEGGTIMALGTDAVAIQSLGTTFDLENHGRIEASGEGALAILATDAFPAVIRNAGTIVGGVVLGGGDDLVDNSGTMGSIDLGAGDDLLRLSGGTFAGGVYGGEGSDSIEIVGGQAAFSTISDVETLRMSAGLAAVSGSAAFDSMTLTGGRMVGLAGSTISAPMITVGQGAIFGSAGTVNGDIAVAGTLSPGASPGTMTVNGNVTLAGTSVSIFEIMPTVSDKLIVNGNLTIASGATLQIDASGIVNPGQSLDLIDADSITGSFTSIVRSGSLYGVLVQDSDTVSLLGEFMNDTAFTPQVQGSIGYVNGLLASGKASGAFLAAVPELAASSSTANQTVFAQLTPEAYASAGQISVEHGLELADVGRSDAFTSRRDTPGLFTFASALGNTRTLEGGPHGASRARINGYGFLGGLGWGGSDWSFGGFVGYLNSQQTLSSLGARTDVDSVVAGVHGRWSNGKLGIKTTVAYNGGNADTRRNLLATSANGSYDLTGWTGDLSVTYAMPLSRGWTVQPTVGLTAIRTVRDQVEESGGSPYALEVARERDHALFVDGDLTFKGGMQVGNALRPYLTLGVRYQVEGRDPFALAALDGGALGLAATGASRAPVLARATMGADVKMSSSLTLFGSVSGEAGNADRRGNARVGLHLAF
ncbi:hypothetical protein I5E68_09600 [Novosphingobium sp. YJ-S2-02]|uniref:Autotransporter domain-containing protein n=1 Tax=Novosphingobium aureum TaxID=2792964 RepID=A0A931ML90_9SPHN|nr:autotransporter outer membrane beta-barrel domain-containing protein [Novosphingobium aureum]MBH0113200.1 hypothetical protein [Novosphingobium aureum]